MTKASIFDMAYYKFLDDSKNNNNNNNINNINDSSNSNSDNNVNNDDNSNSDNNNNNNVIVKTDLRSKIPTFRIFSAGGSFRVSSLF